MAESHNTKFSELVGGRLSSADSQSLWTPIAQEFDRVDGGPDAAKEYLDAQRQSLEERVVNLLDQAKDLLGG